MDDFFELQQNQSSAAERRSRRFHVDIRLRVHTGAANSNRVIFGRGSNISEGGMRVFVPADLAMDDMVTLELMLPYTEQTLRVRGMLRNREGFSYGVEYAASTSAAEREQIARVCKTLALIQ